MTKILIDSADIKKAREIEKYYTIAGITTNPTILSKIEGSLEDKLKELKEFTYGKYEVHVQTTESEVEKIVEEAKKLRDYFGESFYIKIPVTKSGLEAMKLCSKEDIRVTATAILTPMQTLAAAKNGANYVAPYVNRMENVGQDAKEAILEISNLLIDYPTEILAASFKNVKQVQDILRCGAEAVTIAPEIIEASIWHPYTDKSVFDFEKDWGNRFGDKKIVDGI
ncbi:transaldolase family protein [Gemella morbillorum]|uniref:transaldolase family protein n=1 Tax=Gemella morbillorum TaxID=29391 RepID=UPI00254F51E4|nr:transaldolase family protein [Gemella morbillorum]MDK8239911.1 transaldolase family protein [Gemella morbillorum]MDK8254869.1 transaldolase family protein [Gemella morbillorum]